MVNFIVCEFNPFHNGHAYLLQHFHEHPNVCIMSGHVTQRGDFAFTDKWRRTEMALRGGADLVLELSAPFAMGNAEVFARGAVAIARATGLEGRFCFGTEGESLDGLRRLAEISDARLAPTLRALQKNGYSYAAALSAAYSAIEPQAKELLSTPNNVLALEYMRAAKGFSFAAVKRQGTAHDTLDIKDGFCSASALRQCPDQFAAVTPKALHPLYEDILTNDLCPDPHKKDLLWLHALRGLSAEQWDSIAPDGIGRRFYKAVQNAASIENLLEQVKTKCCTFASLRRLAMKAFLGVPPTDTPQYLRVLGANATGKELLSHMTPALPLLIKPAAVKEFSAQAISLMEYESRLTDHFMFMLPRPREKGLEYRTSPIMTD